MTTPIAANTNVQQQAQMCDIPDYRPSYNAVQINMATPTVNAPNLVPPVPETATQEWQA